MLKKVCFHNYYLFKGVNALTGHVATHVMQPVHALELTNTACLCQRKEAFPIAFAGQASKHTQQPLHLCGLSHT
jgi:hypothetical protein